MASCVINDLERQYGIYKEFLSFSLFVVHVLFVKFEVLCTICFGSACKVFVFREASGIRVSVLCIRSVWPSKRSPGSLALEQSHRSEVLEAKSSKRSLQNERSKKRSPQ